MSTLQREGGVVAEGGLPLANKWGGVLLISSVGFVTVLLAYWAVCKWRQGRRSWDRLPAGSLRLAAARNSIENLELLSLLPVGDAGPGQDTCRRRRRLPPVPHSSLAPRMHPSHSAGLHVRRDLTSMRPMRASRRSLLPLCKAMQVCGWPALVLLVTWRARCHAPEAMVALLACLRPAVLSLQAPRAFVWLFCPGQSSIAC